jgi:hypothetical protein
VPATLNPFIWDRPLDDPSKIVGMDGFANEVALTLKAQTNVSLFGPRDTGKTTFTNQLALELAKRAGRDAPPFDVVRVNLQRVVSIPGFIGCVHDAMTSHPVKSVRRRPSANVTSRIVARRYGFSSHSRVPRALERLQGRGLADQRASTWYIVDPLFSEWLRRASPLADRTPTQPFGD